MASKGEFAFIIGYDGPLGVIDSRALAENAGLGAMGLFEKGLYRAAFAAAIDSGNSEEMAAFMEAYNRLADSSFRTEEEFSRYFGVFARQTTKTKRM